MSKERRAFSVRRRHAFVLAVTFELCQLNQNYVQIYSAGYGCEDSMYKSA